jgi:hypothetical protein
MNDPLFYDRFETGEIDPFKKLRTWLFHLKMYWIGDKEYEKCGSGLIPCKGCGHYFLSYQHFDWYDQYCEWCLFSSQDPIQVKLAVENLLTSFWSGKIDWNELLMELRIYNIKVEKPTNWGDCAEWRRRSRLK